MAYGQRAQTLPRFVHRCGCRCGHVGRGGRQRWQPTEPRSGTTPPRSSPTGERCVWSSTFQDVRGLELNDTVLTLSVPSQLVRQRIEQRYLGLMEAALSDAGHGDLALRRRGRDRRPAARTRPGGARRARSGRRADHDGQQHRHPSGESGNGTRRATLSSPSSSARPTASPTLQRSRWPRHPPAATTRSSSTGALGSARPTCCRPSPRYVRENYPTYRVRYISTETLLNEFVDPIRKNAQPSFKRRYREIDVLCSLTTSSSWRARSSSRGVLLHLHSLHEAQRQIVLRLGPPAGRHRDPRGPPCAAVQDGPDHRHPAAGLRDAPGDPAQEGRALGHTVHPTCSSSSPPTSPTTSASSRALIRVSAYAALNNTDLTVELPARSADSISSTKPRQITAGFIIERTAEMFQLDVEQLKGKSRTRDLVHARQVGMYVCRPHRPVLPADRQGVRWSRPHDGHPRLRHDRQPDAGTTQDLRGRDVVDPQILSGG